MNVRRNFTDAAIPVAFTWLFPFIKVIFVEFFAFLRPWLKNFKMCQQNFDKIPGGE
jgi:hypothetical protein